MILKASKKLLSMILALALVLGLMPLSASAATGSMTIGGNNVDLSTNQGGLSSYGWEWDATSNTIMLNSNYVAANNISISCVSTDTIKLVYDGDVTINNALVCMGSLQISGSNGTLTVSARSSNYAISALGNITISGGTITADGGTYDIQAGGDITITGGSVNFKNNKFSNQPKDGNGNDVYLNELIMENLGDGVKITSADIDASETSYGTTDVYTMNGGMVYFWLPQNSSTSESVAIKVNDDTYAAAWARTETIETKTLLKSPYAVTFESNGSSRVNTQYINFFDKVTKPTDPTKDGYIFDGWYTDDGTFQNPWVFESHIVTEPITLYAKWTDNTPPTGEIKIKGSSYTEFQTPITFGQLFFRDAVEIEISGADASGINKIEYIIAESEMSQQELENASWTQYEKKFSINANRIFIIYARITDNEANDTIISSNGIVLYTDSRKDTANISFTKKDTADIAAKVALNGNTVAGITDGTNTLNVDTDYTVNDSNGEITFKADYLNTLAAGNHTLTISYHPLGYVYVDGLDNDSPAATIIELTVNKAVQDISTVSDITKTYGDPAFKISPTASGSPVFTFESSAEDVAKIAEDGTITITGAGETTITIKAAPTDDYDSAETSFKLTVEKAANTITNLTSLNKTYGDSDFIVSPQAMEDPVFSFTSSNPDVVSIDQSTGKAVITGTGSAIITVTAAATANYAATSARFSVNVTKSGGQVITGLTDYEKTYGDASFTLEPAGYEDPVFTFKSSNPDVAAVDHDTGVVTIVNAGTAYITVTAADTSHYTGTSAISVVTVNKAEQTISGLQNLVKINHGAPFIVTPDTNAAAENPAISYQSSNTSVIDFDEDGNFLIKGVGTSTITVQAGETSNYQAAAATFDIKVLADTASLEEVIAAAENLVSGLENSDIGDGDSQYPQDSLDALADAIEKAKAVVNDSDPSQEAADAEAEALRSAIEEFQNSLIRVDFTQLDNAIAQAESLSQSDYTAESWAVLEEALAAGRTERKTKGVTQAEADAAAAEIFAAIAALESVYQFTTDFETFTGSGSVTATIDAPYDKFVSLSVGGVELDQDCYTATEGSTVITLQETYLKTLANGTYAVTARFTDGTAASTLTVDVSGTKAVTGVTVDQSSAKVDTSSGTKGTVKTGDDQNIWLWVSLLGASVLVMLGIYLIRKRKLLAK